MIDPSEYCREIENYLCRKNEGHLIRIVGPVFEQVSKWAAQGVPLAIAFRGIDQYCERYYAKGPRRRPVRVEFCEADVLELFDAWRRAVGVTRLDNAENRETDRGDTKRDSLRAHLDRAIAKLTALRGGRWSRTFDDRVDAAVRELDAARAPAKQARGEARHALISRLAVLDRELLDAARAELGNARHSELRAEAEAEIAPFARRMTEDARLTAIDAAIDRLVRDGVGLPLISPEP
ncbi:MAG TPA: hypothetical protein VEL79_04520 [Vicinamibacterales bacterium]|nr:hypothetical protein [Vicinamibacterales bacterium]